MILETYKGYQIEKNGNVISVIINNKKFTTEVEQEMWDNDGDKKNKNWRETCINCLRSNIDEELGL